MADINREIRAELETHLAAIVGLPDIAYENVPYSPTTGTAYIQAVYMPTARTPAVRGLNPQQKYQGILSLHVHTPDDVGAGAGEAIVKLLLEGFEATSTIGVTTLVSVDYAERTPAFQKAPWYVIPVNIGWYIYN